MPNKITKAINVDTVLAKSAEKRTKMLKDYESKVKPILQKHFDPTDHQVKAITKAVCDNLIYAVEGNPVEQMRMDFTDGARKQFEAFEDYRKKTNDLLECIFRDENTFLIEDFREQFEEKDITLDQSPKLDSFSRCLTVSAWQCKNNYGLWVLWRQNFNGTGEQWPSDWKD